jgi:hypothetical protein
MGKKIDTMYENARTELKQWEQSFIEIVKGKKEV